MVSASDMSATTSNNNSVTVSGSPCDLSRTVRRAYPSRSNHSASQLSTQHSIQYKNSKHGTFPERSNTSTLVHDNASQSGISIEGRANLSNFFTQLNNRGRGGFRHESAAHHHTTSTAHSIEGYHGACTRVRGDPSIEARRQAQTFNIPRPYQVPKGEATVPYTKNVPDSLMGALRQAQTSSIPQPCQVSKGNTTVHDSKIVETVELWVPLCCGPCEKDITKKLLALKGVDAVTCNQMQQKVTVKGTASPADILKQCRELFIQARFW